MPASSEHRIKKSPALDTGIGLILTVGIFISLMPVCLETEILSGLFFLGEGNTFMLNLRLLGHRTNSLSLPRACVECVPCPCHGLEGVVFHSLSHEPVTSLMVMKVMTLGHELKDKDFFTLQPLVKRSSWRKKSSFPWPRILRMPLPSCRLKPCASSR